VRYLQRSHREQKPPSKFAPGPHRSIGVDAWAPSARLSGLCCAGKRAHKDLLTSADSQSALHPHKAVSGGGIHLVDRGGERVGTPLPRSPVQRDRSRTHGLVRQPQVVA
jgi:hypothetical protein